MSVEINEEIKAGGLSLELKRQINDSATGCSSNGGVPDVPACNA